MDPAYLTWDSLSGLSPKGSAHAISTSQGSLWVGGRQPWEQGWSGAPGLMQSFLVLSGYRFK